MTQPQHIPPEDWFSLLEEDPPRARELMDAEFRAEHGEAWMQANRRELEWGWNALMEMLGVLPERRHRASGPTAS